MNFIDLLLEKHECLRTSIRGLNAMLGEASGVGWDDRRPLDREGFSRAVAEFYDAFKAHEAVEDEYLSGLISRLGIDSTLNGAIADGHRSLETLTRLCSAITGDCDGDHVYGVRLIVIHLSAALERHLSFEEREVFPRLRERLPAGLLRELGRSAGAKGAVV